MRKPFTQSEIAEVVASYQSGQSVRQIAIRLSRAPSAVQAHLQEQGLLRTREEYLAARANHIEITPELRSILDGMLLSDASISCGKGRKSAGVTLWQSPVRRGWLEQLQEELRTQGVLSTLDERTIQPSQFKDGRMSPGGDYLVLRTRSYVEFVAERERWHLNGAKAPPLDLRLTPTSLRHWFCGDGTGGDQKGTLGLYTNGFTAADVDRLVALLQSDLNIEATRLVDQRGHSRILIGKRDMAVRVQDLIGVQVVPCCAYKFQHVRPLPETGKGRRLLESTLIAVKQDRGTCTMREAAKRHGVSVSKVWKLWHES